MADQYGVRAVKSVRLFRGLLRSAQLQQAFGFGCEAVKAASASVGFWLIGTEDAC
jgi:hypothetical protein